MGADGGRRLRGGVVRDRSAPGGDRGARCLRQSGRTVVGGHDRHVSATAGGRPAASRKRRDGTRWTGCGHRRAREDRGQGRSHGSFERTRRPHHDARRSRDRCRPRWRGRDSRARGRVRRRSATDVSRSRRSCRPPADVRRPHSQLPCPRRHRKDQSRPRQGARLRRVRGRRRPLARTVRDRAGDRLPRARVRRDEVRKDLGRAVAGTLDPHRDRHHARVRRAAHHVDLSALRAARAAERIVGRQSRGAVPSGCSRARAAYSRPPRHRRRVPGADARGSRVVVGALRRAHLSWRAGARSVMDRAAAAGMGAVPHANRRSVSCQRGHASRRRAHGSLGAARGTDRREGHQAAQGRELMPSRTSIWAAAARVLGAREPDPSVRNPDWLAEKLLGPEELALLGDHPLVAALTEPYADVIKKPEVFGAARILMPRTRFIDDRLSAAIHDGVAQLVILGAGFDSRAYRFADLLHDVRVFEVDHPDTQERKMRRVTEALGELPRHVTYLPVDFKTDSLRDALARAGYRSDRKTFAIWEGVTMYLPGDAVRDVLRWFAGNAAPGSTIIFDYTYDTVIRLFDSIDLETLDENAKQSLMRFRRLTAGEPWLFGLPDKGEQQFLRELGLELRKVMGMHSAEAIETYLTRADGSIVGASPIFGSRPIERQGYLILEAGVPGG